MLCYSLNENTSHRLIYLNAWFLVCKTIWEELVGVAFLKEVCSREWTLGFKSLCQVFSVSVCLGLSVSLCLPRLASLPSI